MVSRVFGLPRAVIPDHSARTFRYQISDTIFAKKEIGSLEMGFRKNRKFFAKKLAKVLAVGILPTWGIGLGSWGRAGRSLHLIFASR
jgi:hypothetical protein